MTTRYTFSIVVLSASVICLGNDIDRCFPATVHDNVLAVNGSKRENVFLNPIMGGDYPDPTIVRDGEDYYMTHSAFNYVPGLTVFHSRDLVNWKPVGYALTEYLGSVWAPDISCHDGRYYIYFTVSAGNDNFSNYVVYADRPEGPWSKPVDLHIGGWIDPCHAVDESTGERWLFMSGLRCEDNIVSGYYSSDGKTWKKESFGMEMSGYNHNTLGDFQSVLPGLFSYGGGSVRFTDLKYSPLPGDHHAPARQYNR